MENKKSSCTKNTRTLNKNFCPKTGKKLNETCSCWVKHKLYNCGFKKCPGLKLHIIEIIQVK